MITLDLYPANTVRRTGHLLNVLCTFNLRPVSKGYIKLFSSFLMSYCILRNISQNLVVL